LSGVESLLPDKIPYVSLQKDLKNVIYKYNAFMLVSHISKYIPEKITNVKLDSNNNIIPPD
jgi:hypothetical protein